MACGSARSSKAWLAACLLGCFVVPSVAHAKKHRPTQQQLQPIAPVEAHNLAVEPEHSLPALVVPPNSAPEPLVILAPEPLPTVEPTQTPQWMLGARAGALFPQPFAPVGTSGHGAFEVGYLVLPRLQFLGILSYTQTQRSQPGFDARLAVPNYRATSISHQAGLALGAMGRLFDLDTRVNPTLTLALQLVMQNLQQQGSAGGANFGSTSQNSLQAGVYVASGIEVLLGTGRLVFEANVTWVPAVRPAPTGTHLGGIGADMGYRLAL